MAYLPASRGFVVTGLMVIPLLSGCGGTNASPTATVTLTSTAASSSAAKSATTSLPVMTAVASTPPAPRATSVIGTVTFDAQTSDGYSVRATSQIHAPAPFPGVIPSTASSYCAKRMSDWNRAASGSLDLSWVVMDTTRGGFHVPSELRVTLGTPILSQTLIDGTFDDTNTLPCRAVPSVANGTRHTATVFFPGFRSPKNPEGAIPSVVRLSLGVEVASDIMSAPDSQFAATCSATGRLTATLRTIGRGSLPPYQQCEIGFG
jgi:hypothetical protein